MVWQWSHAGKRIACSPSVHTVGMLSPAERILHQYSLISVGTDIDEGGWADYSNTFCLGENLFPIKNKLWIMWFIEHHPVIASFFIAKFCCALLGVGGGMIMGLRWSKWTQACMHDEQIKLKAYSSSPSLLPHAQVVNSHRNSSGLFIFRSGKTLVLPTMQCIWCQKLKTDWTQHDNSSLSLKFKTFL